MYLLPASRELNKDLNFPPPDLSLFMKRVANVRLKNSLPCQFYHTISLDFKFKKNVRLKSPILVDEIRVLVSFFTKSWIYHLTYLEFMFNEVLIICISRSLL